MDDRDADESLWGSAIKQTIKRQDPGFNERAFGFKTFKNLLEEAQKRGLVTLEANEKSGDYAVKVKA